MALKTFFREMVIYYMIDLVFHNLRQSIKIYIYNCLTFVLKEPMALSIFVLTGVGSTATRCSTGDGSLGNTTINQRSRLHHFYTMFTHLQAASISEPMPEALGVPKWSTIQVLFWPYAA